MEARLGQSGRLEKPRNAAKILGISYSTLKRWMHTRRIKTVTKAGGDHRIPEMELLDFFTLRQNEILFPNVAPDSGGSVLVTN
jgi:excisionase family DNA binding protein